MDCVGISLDRLAHCDPLDHSITPALKGRSCPLRHPLTPSLTAAQSLIVLLVLCYAMAGAHVNDPPLPSRRALQDGPVAEHPDAYVRKSALVATAELLRAVPAPRLAGAMMRGGGGDDAAFAARLEQLQEQLRATHATSPDATLRCARAWCHTNHACTCTGGLRPLMNIPQLLCALRIAGYDCRTTACMRFAMCYDCDTTAKDAVVSQP